LQKHRIASLPASSFENAVKILDAALAQLETAAHRKLDLERRRGDLETELAIMQDDRSRLAIDLDGATSRLKNVETAAAGALQRLDRAMLTIRSVLGDDVGNANANREH
jgi:predicted  nucleic acid-binding Zn-ribbon protein